MDGTAVHNLVDRVRADELNLPGFHLQGEISHGKPYLLSHFVELGSGGGLPAVGCVLQSSPGLLWSPAKSF